METLNLEYFDKANPLFERLSTLGIPRTRTEHYRNFPITQILSKTYNTMPLQQSGHEVGSRLVIINGVVVEAPKGLKLSYKENFSADLGHYDSSYYMSHMLSEKVIHIELDEDRELNIEHWFNYKDTLLSYRLVIQVNNGATVRVYERFKTRASENSLLLYGIDAELSNESSLNWVRYEHRLEDETNLIGSHHFHCQKNANFELSTFDFGSVNSLHLYKIDLEEKSNIDASHLLLVSEDAKRGNVIHINHKGESAKSAQEARSIVKGTATGIFDAKIMVADNAKYASAKQNSKAILLDEYARMYAKPQLEIYTDELEASHGSTIGSLDEDALFYLCSRGIKQEEAKKMLVLAFANSFIDKLSDEVFAKALHADFEQTI
jgi:Fe-S cluster assembly protein SufD